MVDDVVIIRNEEIRLAHRIVDDGSYSHPVIKCLDSKKLLITTVCNKLQRKKTYIRRIRFGFRIYYPLRSQKKIFLCLLLFFPSILPHVLFTETK